MAAASVNGSHHPQFGRIPTTAVPPPPSGSLVPQPSSFHLAYLVPDDAHGKSIPRTVLSRLRSSAFPACKED